MNEAVTLASQLSSRPGLQAEPYTADPNSKGHAADQLQAMAWKEVRSRPGPRQDGIEGGGLQEQQRQLVEKWRADEEAQYAKKQQQKWERFHQGQIHVLVATKAIQFGVDTRGVRQCIFFKPVRNFGFTSVLDIYQQLGRAGRGGHKSDIMFLVDTKAWSPAPNRSPLQRPADETLKLLLSSPPSQCMAQTLAALFDGNATVQCAAASKCTWCIQHQHVPNHISTGSDIRTHQVTASKEEPRDAVLRRTRLVNGVRDLLGPLKSPKLTKPSGDPMYQMLSSSCGICWMDRALDCLARTTAVPFASVFGPGGLGSSSYCYVFNKDPPHFTMQTFDASVFSCHEDDMFLPHMGGFSGDQLPIVAQVLHTIPHDSWIRPGNKPTGFGDLRRSAAAAKVNTYCWCCALQHSINGVAFQPDEAFEVNGKCESGVQELFWRFCQRLYILHSTNE